MRNKYTDQQVRSDISEFISEIIEREFRNENWKWLLELIASRFDMEDLYTDKELGQWAEDHGYTKS